MSKTKAHTRYKTKDGNIVPGVTTITEELGWNKRVLINWANRIGLEGIDCNKYKDDKADIGTLAHSFITDTLRGQKTNTDDYSKNQISQAENSVISFYEWEKSHKLKPIIIEEPLISEVHKFGGSLDIYGLVDDCTELIDLKSGSGIYEEHKVQVAAYWLLLSENGYKIPDKIRIINVPRSEDERFEDLIIHNIELYAEIFLNCLKNYYLKKQIKDIGSGKSDDFYEYVKGVSK